MKELEGEDVFLEPTGNNARIYKMDIVRGRVVKVAKVFVNMTVGDSIYEKKFRISSFARNHLQCANDNNSGWYVYRNEEELRDKLEHDRLSSLMAEKFRSKMDYKTVSLDVLRDICSKLGLE